MAACAWVCVSHTGEDPSGSFARACIPDETRCHGHCTEVNLSRAIYAKWSCTAKVGAKKAACHRRVLLSLPVGILTESTGSYRRGDRRNSRSGHSIIPSSRVPSEYYNNYDNITYTRVLIVFYTPEIIDIYITVVVLVNSTHYNINGRI